MEKLQIRFVFDEPLNNTQLEVWVALVEYVNLLTVGGGDEFYVIYPPDGEEYSMLKHHVAAQNLFVLAVESGMKASYYVTPNPFTP